MPANTLDCFVITRHESDGPVRFVGLYATEADAQAEVAADLEENDWATEGDYSVSPAQVPLVGFHVRPCDPAATAEGARRTLGELHDALVSVRDSVAFLKTEEVVDDDICDNAAETLIEAVQRLNALAPLFGAGPFAEPAPLAPSPYQQTL